MVNKRKNSSKIEIIAREIRKITASVEKRIWRSGAMGIIDSRVTLEKIKTKKIKLIHKRN